MITDSAVRIAHADAWQVEGLLRVPFGGGVGTVSGARLMSSGINRPQWNGADVDDPERADVSAMRDWYAARDAPWGVRIAAGAHWPHGRFLFRTRLMGLALDRAGQRAARGQGPAGLAIRKARPADLEAVLRVDSIGFDVDPEVNRPWIEPYLDAAAVDVALAELDGEPVATAHALYSDGQAGRAVYLGGVTVIPRARRRGIAAAISRGLVRRAAAQGARFAHLHTESDEAARVYAGLGFAEVNGLDIYVDL